MKYLISRNDGGVSIMHLIEGVPEDEIAKWPADLQATVVFISPVDDADIPKDRTFRNAWKPDLSVDMDKARDIHMDRIRIERDRELARLDIEQLKGRDVTADKQALRDIPQTFDLTQAATPDELKALWPVELQK